MNRRSGLFDDTAGATKSPRLDASRMTGGPISWFTPNRLVAGCRISLGLLLLVLFVLGPDGFGSPALRFAAAYGAALVAMPAFPRISGRALGGAIALLLGIRWAFSTPDGATADMLLTQVVGVICAVMPVYARGAGRLAGSIEGHISFIDRRTTWRRHAADPPQAAASAASHASPAPIAPTIALLDYRPEAEA